MSVYSYSLYYKIIFKHIIESVHKVKINCSTMKLDFAVILVVLGTISCATYTDSTSSNIETGNDNHTTSLIGLLKLVDQTVNLQRFYDDDSQDAEVELSSDAMTTARNFMLKGIAQLVSHFSGETLQEARQFIRHNGRAIAKVAGHLTARAVNSSEKTPENSYSVLYRPVQSGSRGRLGKSGGGQLTF